MKKVVGGIFVVVFVAVATVALGQPWQGWKNCGGWCAEYGGGPGRQAGMYDPAKVETLTGEVTSVEQVSPGRRMGQGIGLKLKTANGVILVHLGPQWYIERQGDIKIAAGDAVEIKGVKVERKIGTIFIAAEVKKGNDVLKLRDENGYPAWAGWRRGGQAQ